MTTTNDPEIANLDPNLDPDLDESLAKKIIPSPDKETPESLKVKSDPPDLDPDERKRRVKKLAGAISHSLRSKGVIYVRCFGSASISKAVKALTIAKDYVAVQSEEKKLHLYFSPAFITADIGGTDLTGIVFRTFAAAKNPEDEVDIDKVKSVLMVKSDPKDIVPEERRLAVKKLAGAISHSLEENKECVVRGIGSAAIGKAAKALAIARGYTATRGPDLYAWSKFIVANINGQEKTGIAFFVYAI